MHINSHLLNKQYVLKQRKNYAHEAACYGISLSNYLVIL